MMDRKEMKVSPVKNRLIHQCLSFLSDANCAGPYFDFEFEGLLSTCGLYARCHAKHPPLIVYTVLYVSSATSALQIMMGHSWGSYGHPRQSIPGNREGVVKSCRYRERGDGR